MTDQVLFPERFKNPARYYTNGRPTYPKLLAKRVASAIALRPDDRVLDLGTGPGFLAIDYAALGSNVTAIDPSDEMLTAARDNAARAGAQIRFLKGSSFELSSRFAGELAQLKLVTIGRAFHWMERAETLAALEPLVERGGAVVLFGERYPEVAENLWHKEFQALLDSYSTDDPAKPRLRGNAQNEAIFLASSFDHLERIAVLERRQTPVERFVDRALSFGAAWDGRPGSREDDLASEVRALINRYARDGIVHEVIEGHALLGLRSRDLALD